MYRNKEAQERENKRLQTKINNLEAELARERAIIKQEQHKTVISVTDAYDERLVNNLKMEVDRAKDTADNLEKQYLEAAEERDTALTELEELKRKNAELEKKLEQALSVRVYYRNTFYLNSKKIYTCFAFNKLKLLTIRLKPNSS